MWGEMAELALNHFKENDFIYVSGTLGSYTKADHNGINKLYHEVYASFGCYLNIDYFSFSLRSCSCLAMFLSPIYGVLQ